MTKEQIETYYIEFEKLQKNEISYIEWGIFCTVLLEEIMEEHKDVFVRLKERG